MQYQEVGSLKKTQHSSLGDAKFGQLLAATAAVTLSGVGLGLTLAGDAQAKPRSEAQARKHNPANRPTARTSPIRVNGSATPGSGNEHAYKIVEEHVGMSLDPAKSAANSSKTTAATSGESQMTAASPEK